MDYELQTGDLVFFSNNWSKYIKPLVSPICHVGIIITNHTDGSSNLLHAYQNYEDEMRYEIRVDNLKTFIDSEFPSSEIVVRRVYPRYEKIMLTNKILTIMNQIPHLKQVSLIDWVNDILKQQGVQISDSWSRSFYHNTHRYWASCLVGYIYSQLGWLSNQFDWNRISPDMLSKEVDGFSIKIDSVYSFSRRDTTFLPISNTETKITIPTNEESLV